MTSLKETAGEKVLQKIQTRLEIKILLLIVLVLIIGFGTYVVLSIQNESQQLLEGKKRLLRGASATLMAGIRNVMLTGKAPFAIEMVNDVRQNVKFVDVTIYDRFGREVFLREGEGTNTSATDSTVNNVLATHAAHAAVEGSGTGRICTKYDLVLNHPECFRCHDKSESVRGVLHTALRPSALDLSLGISPERAAARAMGATIAAAFRTLMLGGNGGQMDTLMKQMRGVPAVRILKVYGRYGFLRFGPEDEIIPDERIRQITKERTTEFQFEEHGAALRLFVPMVNDDRCQVCHGSKWPMRGVIVLEFKRNELAHIAADIDQRFTTALQMVVTEGFRSIMLVGRANSTRFYLDELRTMPIFESVRVFDNKGGERFLNPPPRKLMATQAAEHRDTVEYTYAVDGESFLVRAEPVLNEQRCFACHASAQKVRGVVEVRSSLADIHAEIQRNQYRSLAVALVTFGLVWLVIRYFMRSMVVKPVQLIENVATRVGRGDFTVRASVDSKDEIGSLARQINEMVVGLRERFHLQKFVSQQTVVTIRQNEAGVDMTAGRKTATVFFSDIRGFTSYSERTKPERVIAMLNACLSTQAAIIGKHGGDIDNYVGDEVFAVFEGEGMVERAVRAALEIQTTVISSLQQTDRKAINIGIGINTGEMVMGALGSEERKALTVIGDNVNLGARLCGAAKGKQILLSETSAKHLIGHPEFAVKKLRPIEVKGKRAPINIFEVRSKKSLSKKQKQ